MQRVAVMRQTREVELRMQLQVMRNLRLYLRVVLAYSFVAKGGCSCIGMMDRLASRLIQRRQKVYKYCTPVGENENGSS